MSIYHTDILKVIANNPRVRMPEICDVVGCDPEHVELAVKELLREGHIIRVANTAPNGKSADGFYFTPSSSKADLYRSVKPQEDKAAPAKRGPKPRSAPSTAAAQKTGFDCAAWASGAITLIRDGQEMHLEKEDADKVFGMLERLRVAHG
jgi:hypothetical protein